MSTRIIEPLVTVEQLASMPEDGNRYEVIEGEIFMSRAPSLEHQDFVLNICSVFRRHLSATPVGKVYPGIGVMFSEFSGVIPDVVYISHGRRARLEKQGRIYGAPEIVIEIVSPGRENEERDRISKLQLYSRHGVTEYWIVNPFNRVIEIYRREDLRLQLAATVMDGDEITTPILEGFRCTVAEIFAE